MSCIRHATNKCAQSDAVVRFNSIVRVPPGNAGLDLIRHNRRAVEGSKLQLLFGTDQCSRAKRPKADMLTALKNVCFWENSGHTVHLPLRLLLTQSGHR